MGAMSKIGAWWSRMLSGVSSPSRWFLEWAGVSPTQSGITVSETTALTYSAVWAATRIISETIASLPLKVYHKTDKGREEGISHQLYYLLHDAPNNTMDTFSFRETMSASLINWGNAYAELSIAPNNRIVSMTPLHPSFVEPKWDEDKGELYYIVYDEPNHKNRVVLRKDMWHITGTLSGEGLIGKGVIRQARESIGMGMATERYGAAFFGNGARPGGVIEHPGTRPLSPTAADGLRDHWEKMHQGVGNSHKVAILREGATYKTIGIPPEEAQFLETRVHNISEIARWYRLPPHMLADLSHAAYTNIEHESLNFVRYSIMPWLRRIECSINRQLIRDPSYYAEFVVDGLLRGDKKSRTEANVMEFMHGKLTPNEWRAQDNLNPLDSKYGDEHFVPLNLVPLSKLDEMLNAQSKPQPSSSERNGVKPKEPTNPKSAPATPKKNSAIDAANEALAATKRRLLAVEVNALRLAAKHPDRFLDKVEDFYAKHRVNVYDAILPLHRILHAVEGFSYLEPPMSENAVEIAAENDTLALVTDHKIAVVNATDCKPAQLAGVIDTLTQSWQEEPKHAEAES